MSNEELKTLMTAAAVKALELTGQVSPLISYHKASRLYGSWFIREAACGRILPADIGGKGKNTTRRYRTTDILARAAEMNNEQ